jgi:hypothetical protein
MGPIGEDDTTVVVLTEPPLLKPKLNLLSQARSFVVRTAVGFFALFSCAASGFSRSCRFSADDTTKIVRARRSADISGWEDDLDCGGTGESLGGWSPVSLMSVSRIAIEHALDAIASDEGVCDLRDSRLSWQSSGGLS